MSEYKWMTDPDETGCTGSALDVLKACIRATCHYCAAQPGSFVYGWSGLQMFGGGLSHVNAHEFIGFIPCKAASIRRAFAFMEPVND